jgi:peptide/nickel transport system ATP-binding protein
LAGDNIEQTVLDLLRRVALEPAEQFIDKYPHELSGGQRQRVSIARSLAVQPRVLIADEPVSMLDVSIRLGVLNLLADLRDRERIAILYVTHDIASARYLADTIMVMYAGRVVEVAPAASMTSRPAHPYTKLLLSAAPDPETEEKTWVGESGAPPSLVDPPSGCRFHPRCPFAMDICRTEAPPSFPVADDHTAECWLLDPGRTEAAGAATRAAAVSGESAGPVSPNVSAGEPE